jgi:hypothetical protein
MSLDNLRPLILCLPVGVPAQSHSHLLQLHLFIEFTFLVVSQVHFLGNKLLHALS